MDVRQSFLPHPTLAPEAPLDACSLANDIVVTGSAEDVRDHQCGSDGKDAESMNVDDGSESLNSMAAQT